MRNATVSFVMSVRLSVQMEQFGSHWRKFDILTFFENLSRKFKFHYNLLRITGTLHEGYFTWRVLYMKTNIHFLSYVSHFLLEWEMFHTKAVQNLQTHAVSSVTFFSLENRAVYETMWKNIVERGRPQMTIWCMRIACWIHEAKNTPPQTV
jgi:hypothetical protein